MEITKSEYDNFYLDKSKVSYSYYTIKPPLIKPSKLTFNESGKELSDGYALNFAVGCTHACRFCYVDSIHKRFTLNRLNNDAIARSWGMYLLIPNNIEDAIFKTPWYKWKDKEVMLSSTHDPYLSELASYTRRILETSLPYGVRYCIQTRSLLVKNDFDLLSKYKNQIRLQYSIATLNEELAKLIEPRVPLPYSRLNVLKEASKLGLKVGVIIAPIFPIEGWLNDLENIFKELTEISYYSRIDVYGEALHIRGTNIEYIKEVFYNKRSNIRFINELDKTSLLRFDKLVGEHFNALLTKYRLNGRYWYEN
jgi:DNA repair photolyase